MGSTVENADKIKRATYSFRQYYRNKQLEQENDADYNSEESNDYAGRKQTHREEEEYCNHIIDRLGSCTQGIETIANHLQQELPSLLSSAINSEVMAN